MTAKTVKQPNYTAEMTAEIVTAFKAAPTRETVEMLANKLGRSSRAIIAKLVRENCYVKPERMRKDGTKVQLKAETATAIGAILGLSEPDTSSLEKVTRKALHAIFNALANSKPLVD